jgi:hypothetical protein
MSQDGKTVVYAYEGKLFEWNEGGKTKPIPVEMPESRLEPCSISTDGTAVLFHAGRKHGKHGWVRTTYLLRRSGKNWQEPVLILEDRTFSVWAAVLTPTGDAVVFKKIDNPKRREGRRETIQRIGLQDGKAAKPETLLDLPDHSDCKTLVLSRSGAMAYSAQTCVRPLTYQLFYVPKLEAGVKPVNLSRLLAKALGRPVPPGNKYPENDTPPSKREVELARRIETPEHTEANSPMNWDMVHEALQVVVSVIAYAFFIYCVIRMVQKMGYSWHFVLFVLVLFPVALIYLAFKEWPVETRMRIIKSKLDRLRERKGPLRSEEDTDDGPS